MLNWLKTLLRKPLDLPEAPEIDVPIRYVNTRDTSFGGNFPGYFRFCINLDTGKITKEHIEGMHVTDEICELDIKIAYDRLSSEYKQKYKKYLERMHYNTHYLD